MALIPVEIVFRSVVGLVLQIEIDEPTEIFRVAKAFIRGRGKKKLALEDMGTLDEEAAIMVKNEALKNLKERLLTRAEIIQQRLQQEQDKLEHAFVSNGRLSD